MGTIEMSELDSQKERKEKLEIEERIGLLFGSDVEQITRQLSRSLRIDDQSIIYQGSDRYYVFAQPQANESGKLTYPHIAVVHPDNDTSYVRVKIPEGKKPLIESVSRKKEHILKFDAKSTEDRDRAISEGLLLLNTDPQGLIFAPKFRKDKWLFTYNYKDVGFEISGDRVVVSGNQPFANHNRFAHRTLSVIELELLEPEKYNDKQLQEVLFQGKTRVIKKLVENNTIPTYIAPGKSSFSQQLLIEAGELKPQSIKK